MDAQDTTTPTPDAPPATPREMIERMLREADNLLADYGRLRLRRERFERLHKVRLAAVRDRGREVLTPLLDAEAQVRQSLGLLHQAIRTIGGAATYELPAGKLRSKWATVIEWPGPDPTPPEPAEGGDREPKPTAEELLIAALPERFLRVKVEPALDVIRKFGRMTDAGGWEVPITTPEGEVEKWITLPGVKAWREIQYSQTPELLEGPGDPDKEEGDDDAE